jgi:hypothetical protein
MYEAVFNSLISLRSLHTRVHRWGWLTAERVSKKLVPKVDRVNQTSSRFDLLDPHFQDFFVKFAQALTFWTPVQLVRI